MTRSPEMTRHDLGLPDDFLSRVWEILNESERLFLKEYIDPLTQRLPPDAPTIIFQQAEGVADTFPAASEEEKLLLHSQAREIVRKWWSEFQDRYYGVD